MIELRFTGDDRADVIADICDFVGLVGFATDELEEELKRRNGRAAQAKQKPGKARQKPGNAK